MRVRVRVRVSLAIGCLSTVHRTLALGADPHVERHHDGIDLDHGRDHLHRLQLLLLLRRLRRKTRERRVVRIRRVRRL